MVFLLYQQVRQSRENGEQIARKIIEVASTPVAYKNELLNVGASVGVAFYPKDGDDFETLVKQADDAMYAAKKAGKNGFRFAGEYDTSDMTE